MSTNSDLEEYAKSLKRKMWITNGSRFNAARRLNNKYQFSLSSISILSIYGIGIPLFQSIAKNPQCKEINDIYNAISLILSVFTLVISLLEGAKNYQLRAEKLHKNAIEVSELQQKLEHVMVSQLGDADFHQKVGDILIKYNEIIKECSENHDSEDYNLFKAQNRKDFKMSWLDGLYIKIKLIMIDYWLYAFVIGIPPILFFLYSSC
jgi:hypothetical protein